MRPKELYSMCDEWNNIFLVVAVEKCKRGMAKSHKKVRFSVDVEPRPI